jgi:iron complex transport system substrate-binding protein
VADPAAQNLRRRLADLRERYAGRRKVRVFYQVWHRPVVTLGAEHLVSRALEACGGANVFAALDGLAPQVGVEAVLLADPEAIVASAGEQGRPPWLDEWREWPHLTAVREGHLYALPPDLLQRPGPRFVDGVEALCRLLERIRAAR